MEIPYNQSQYYNLGTFKIIGIESMDKIHVYSFLYALESYLIRVAIVKYPRLGTWNNRNLFVTVFLEAKKSKINMLMAS